MKIISKHQDYYDSALAYGADETIVYVRHTELFKWERKSRFSRFYDNVASPYPESFSKYVEVFNNFPVRKFQNETIYRYEDIISCELIGFCGKIYPVYVFSVEKYGVKDERFYDLVSLKKHIEQYNSQYKHKRERSYYETYSYGNPKGYSFTEKSLEQWLADVEALNKSKHILDVFFDINAPTFVITRNSGEGSDYDAVIVNPILKEYDFYKIMDPYNTFGQISQFIGGVLPQEGKETIEFTDKEKIQAHGFDKMSFRKEPGSKRRKK